MKVTTVDRMPPHALEEIARLKADNVELEYKNRKLVEWAHQHNAELQAVVDAAKAFLASPHAGTVVDLRNAIAEVEDG